MHPSPIPLNDWKQEAEMFTYGAHKVFFKRLGDGPPLLMLHGFPTCSWDWSWIAEALSQHFSLIIPDMMDAGQSRNNYGRPVSVMQQADMLAALMEKLDIPAAHVLAHDLGDTIAQEMLARQAERRLGFRMLSVAYLNGGLLPEFHRPTDGQKLLAGPFGWFAARFANKDTMLTGLASVFGEKTRPGREILDSLWPSIVGINGRGNLRRRIRYIAERREQEHRWVGALKGATIPQMLINGTADPVSGEHAADGLKRRAPGITVEKLAGIGHYPQLEAPDEVTALFLGWHRSLGTV